MTSKRSGSKTSRAAGSNPFFARWNTTFGIAPFSQIEPRHFSPAFKKAFSRHRADIKMIAGRQARPTFTNTIQALEKSGALLMRVADVFFNLAGAASSEALQKIERELAPRLANHRTALLLNAKLFKRID